MEYILSASCQIANLSEIYQQYFGDLKKGLFVEVGAFDGYEFSNTWGLAHAGWRGIYYEPVPDFAKKCKEIHALHDVTVITAAVGAEPKEAVKLYMGENPTIDQETALLEPWGTKYDVQHYIEVPQVSLDLSLELLIPDSMLDLLVIDVEGGELEVLKGCDLNLWKPRMLIIETHKNNPDSRKAFRSDDIFKVISKYPYTEIQSDGVNTIFWRTA